MTDLAVELQRLGHRVSVLTTTPHYNLDQAALIRQPLQSRWGGWLYFSEWQGIPVWHVKLAMKRKNLWIRALDYVRFHLLSLLASIRTLGQQDVVIATSPPLTIGLISWLLGWRWHAPSVYKVAEIYPDLAIRQGVVRGRLMIGLMRWVERLVYSRNTIVVSIATQFSDVIRSRGVPDHKLFTIPDFVDTDLYHPMSRHTRFAEEHGLLEDFVVLYGGNIGIVQDWESVLYAAKQTEELPILFVIVGDGSRCEWLARETAQRGLMNMRLLGYQSKELMPEINSSCDIGIIPLTRAGAQDGFPSKIYSLLASAKPVIVSADEGSGMAQMVEQIGCGRVVPPEDRKSYTEAILKAFHERDRLPVEGERGRRFVEKDYSKDGIALKYDALIRTLVKH